MSRKRTISALLNENPRKKIKKTKVICNCNKCNGLLVDRRTNLLHKYQQKNKEKNQNLTTNQEFTFRFKTRNTALNRIMSFDTDQHNSAIDRISIYSNSKDENESDNDAESNESFESDDNAESNKSFESNNIFENYLTPAFELPSHSDIFTDS